jgi:hypothetical protein
MTTGPRTWREIPPARSRAIRDLLVQMGGVPDAQTRGTHESWRVRLGRAVFTGYTTGTVYCTGGDEPELDFLYTQVERLAQP